MKRLAKWIGRVKDATLNDQWFMLAMVCAAAGVFGFYGYVALDRWLFKRAANAIVQGMERYALTNGFKILHNTFEVETHSHATNTEWPDYLRVRQMPKGR